MSFFDDFPRPPPPPEPERRIRQPWEGAPEGVIGGWVPWRVVLVRSDRASAQLRDFEAFPTGLRFELVAYWKDAEATRPIGRRHRMRDPEALRIGVRFSDGRKTASSEWFNHGDEGDPAHPVLRPGGGGGGAGEWKMSYWLWPLPPPGPLTWVSSWPEVGATETSVEVDASVLEEAAAASEKLWDDNREFVPRGYSRMTSSLRTRLPGDPPPTSP
jgi:hypothetical protein